jgi:TPR repeat protein
MCINKLTLTLALSLLLSSGVAIAADFSKGLQAAQAGDWQTALAEWTPLAKQGDSTAQYNLGLMYANGWGVPQNDKTAVKWYTKAAEQGDANAQFNLGNKYDNGKGVPENDKTAVKWFTLAAEQGVADAQSNLGFMYDKGEGVLTDTKRAYMWYNLAGYNGSEIGSKNKDKLAKQMTPADISKAQDMSSRCLESNYTDC